MVIDHPCRLHESIAYCRTHEPEAAFFEVCAECIGLGGSCRDLRQSSAFVALRLPPDKAPEVGIEGTELPLKTKDQLRVRDRRLDLQSVPDDAIVLHETLHIASREARHHGGIESPERLPIVLPL